MLHQWEGGRTQTLARDLSLHHAARRKLDYFGCSGHPATSCPQSFPLGVFCAWASLPPRPFPGFCPLNTLLILPGRPSSASSLPSGNKSRHGASKSLTGKPVFVMGSANYCLRPKSGPLPVVNKVLLGHGHAHFFYLLCMALCLLQWQSPAVSSGTVQPPKLTQLLSVPFQASRVADGSVSASVTPIRLGTGCQG